jgi:integrase
LPKKQKKSYPKRQPVCRSIRPPGADPVEFPPIPLVRHSVGPLRADVQLVVVGPDLEPEDVVLDRLVRPLKRAGVPTVRFHDLRHCCASLMLAAGVDTKTVSARLGHASPR